MNRVDILRQLETIATAHVGIAIAWHVAILVAAVAVVRWEPSTRQAVVMTAAVAASVFLAAAGYGSWFNAISFGVLAILLVTPRRDLAPRWRTRVPAWSSVLGIASIGFGLWYPHFREGWLSSPVGLLPCPSLAVVGGIALVAGGFGSRFLPGVLAVWAAFYGAVGAFALGVEIDIALLVVALGLARLAVRP